MNNVYDLTPFTAKEIKCFTKCCEKCVLFEVFEDTDDKINAVMEEFRRRLREFDLSVDLENKCLYMNVLGVNIIFLFEKTPTIPSGYDIDTGNIYLFLGDFKQALSKETEITLEHELQHYFDLKDTSANKCEYRAFISAAKHILLTNKSTINQVHNGKLPKELVTHFFNNVAEGKIPVYARWFKELSDEKKQDVLDRLLHELAESFQFDDKLGLTEVTLHYELLK